MNVTPEFKNSSAKLSFKPGRYLYHPKQGACVLTAVEQGEYAGFKLLTAQLHPLADPHNIIKTPVARLAGNGVRDISSIETLEKALKIFEGKAAAKSKTMWSRRALIYNSALGEGNPVETAGVVHTLLSGERKLALEPEQIGPTLPYLLEISHSERVIAQNGVNLLAGELAIKTGMTLQEAATMVCRAALIDGHAKTIKLNKSHAAVTSMAEVEFKALFSVTLAQARAGQPVKLAPRQAIFVPAAPSVKGKSRADATEKAARKPREGYVLKPKPCKPDLEDLRDAEKPLAARGGPGLKMFIVAVDPKTDLTREEFQVLSQTMLRYKTNRVGMDKAARDLNMVFDDAVQTYDSAVVKLTKAMGDSAKLRNYNGLRPYAELKKDL